MEIRFWGVRGSVASSGTEVSRIGGNTSCVEVRSNDSRLILDAGTGIRGLGAELRDHKGSLALLFSHLHWDHVQGFPFFAPAYSPNVALTLYGPSQGEATLAGVLAKQMEAPCFPVPFSALRARIDFRPAQPDVPFEIGPFRVLPFAVPHPQGCLGYRIEADGACFVYMTDVELSPQTVPAGLIDRIAGAHGLCHDAQYTPDEYAGLRGPSRRGWGHSTMIDAALIAKQAQVERLFLFHHDPAHNDDEVEDMAEAARAVFEPTEPARENKRVRVGT